METNSEVSPEVPLRFFWKFSWYICGRPSGSSISRTSATSPRSQWGIHLEIAPELIFCFKFKNASTISKFVRRSSWTEKYFRQAPPATSPNVFPLTFLEIPSETILQVSPGIFPCRILGFFQDFLKNSFSSSSGVRQKVFQDIPHVLSLKWIQEFLQ